MQSTPEFGIQIDLPAIEVGIGCVPADGFFLPCPVEREGDPQGIVLHHLQDLLAFVLTESARIQR